MTTPSEKPDSGKNKLRPMHNLRPMRRTRGKPNSLCPDPDPDDWGDADHAYDRWMDEETAPKEDGA